MKIYDISLDISEKLPVWPGDPKIGIEKKCSIENGDICNVTSIILGVHTGTHIDAPYHFVNDGRKTDEIKIQEFIGECLVVEIDTDDFIKKEHLMDINLDGIEKILFKTKNSILWETKVEEFNENFISLDLSAAEYLVNKGIKLIGVDYLSIEGFFSKDAIVHKTLLGNNIIVVEGLNLFGIESKKYELICLPIKLVACDGSPARVILKEIQEKK